MKLSEAKDILKEYLLDTVPILFLGAGFSIGAQNGMSSMDGKSLKEYIFDNLVKGKIGEEYYREIREYDLRKLCDQVNFIYKRKNELEDLLTNCYKGTKPNYNNPFHLKLTSYPWKKIYTVNIDDLVESIYKENNVDLFVQNENKLKKDNNSNDSTVLYKLHGCVNNRKEGYIFSQADYTELITKKLDAKLNSFTVDIVQNNIIFIGVSLDEPDIEYYLSIYSGAGYKLKNNKIVIIDKKPNLNLIRKTEELGALLIEASAEEFLNFVQELNYNPDKLEKATISMNYSGIYRLTDIEKTYKKPYESRLYLGDYCNWQDVADNWLFIRSIIEKAKDNINTLMQQNEEVSCFSIYGKIYSGKTCLAKQLAYDLGKQGYDVLEYRGKTLNKNCLKDYILASPYNKFVLLIDGASYYYQEIEKLFEYSFEGKNLLILTVSREYYHKKRKYYLEGNNYMDFEIPDKITREDAERINDVLEIKSYLSYMGSMEKEQRIKDIYGRKSIVNFIFAMTYGNINKNVENTYNKMYNKLTDIEKKLLIELAIFDFADIDYYPKELFIERYGKIINVEDMKIVDLVRSDGNGLMVRNFIFNKKIIRNNKQRIEKIMIEILKNVSRYVSERANDMWYIIFQCLLKEDVLEKRLHLKHDVIRKIFLSVKEEYKEVSYYWLQLGIMEQKAGDYSAAYNYLLNSARIRPQSYKIQHAIARNYMIHANNIEVKEQALSIFIKGEEKMMKLIDSDEYGKIKARPYSVNCFITEKIKFYEKFGIVPSDKELIYMRDILDSIDHYNIDTYIKRSMKNFFLFLQKIGKLEILHMDFNSPYLKYVGRKDINIDLRYNNDPFTETI